MFLHVLTYSIYTYLCILFTCTYVFYLHVLTYSIYMYLRILFTCTYVFYLHVLTYSIYMFLRIIFTCTYVFYLHVLTYPNQPHLLKKYQINMGFLHFHEIGILSGMYILAPYQIDFLK